MGGPRQVQRRWIEDFLPNAARLRCFYEANWQPYRDRFLRELQS